LNAYNADVSRNPHHEAWKLLAARLNAALGALREDTRNRDAYINQVVQELSNRLSQVNGAQPIDPSELATWLDGHQPPEGKALYKDDPTSVVRSSAKGG
jgi:hypothetical protein